jgi:hypothetical protein
MFVLRSRIIRPHSEEIQVFLPLMARCKRDALPTELTALARFSARFLTSIFYPFTGAGRECTELQRSASACTAFQIRVRAGLRGSRCRTFHFAYVNVVFV